MNKTLDKDDVINLFKDLVPEEYNAIDFLTCVSNGGGMMSMRGGGNKIIKQFMTRVKMLFCKNKSNRIAQDVIITSATPGVTRNNVPQMIQYGPLTYISQLPDDVVLNILEQIKEVRDEYITSLIVTIPIYKQIGQVLPNDIILSSSPYVISICLLSRYMIKTLLKLSVMKWDTIIIKIQYDNGAEIEAKYFDKRFYFLEWSIDDFNNIKDLYTELKNARNSKDNMLYTDSFWISQQSSQKTVSVRLDYEFTHTWQQRLIFDMMHNRIVATTVTNMEKFINTILPEAPIKYNNVIIRPQEIMNEQPTVEQPLVAPRPPVQMQNNDYLFRRTPTLTPQQIKKLSDTCTSLGFESILTYFITWINIQVAKLNTRLNSQVDAQNLTDAYIDRLIEWLNRTDQGNDYVKQFLKCAERHKQLSVEYQDIETSGCFVIIKNNQPRCNLYMPNFWCKVLNYKYIMKLRTEMSKLQGDNRTRAQFMKCLIPWLDDKLYRMNLQNDKVIELVESIMLWMTVDQKDYINNFLHRVGNQKVEYAIIDGFEAFISEDEEVYIFIPSCIECIVPSRYRKLVDSAVMNHKCKLDIKIKFMHILYNILYIIFDNLTRHYISFREEYHSDLLKWLQSDSVAMFLMNVKDDYEISYNLDLKCFDSFDPTKPGSESDQELSFADFQHEFIQEAGNRNQASISKLKLKKDPTGCVLVLGRQRTVWLQGRKKYVYIKRNLVALSDARRIERRNILYQVEVIHHVKNIKVTHR